MKYLHLYGIYHNNVKRTLFDNFLLKRGNEHHLQKFFIFCHTLDHKWIEQLIREFEFTLNDGITYKQLIQLHPEWAKYFKENIDKFGYPTDNRIGVKKSTAHKVMRFYVDDLDKAMQLAYTPRGV